MVSAEICWDVVVVGGWDVVFCIVDVLFEVFELCSVLLYYALATEGTEFIYVESIS